MSASRDEQDEAAERLDDQLEDDTREQAALDRALDHAPAPDLHARFREHMAEAHRQLQETARLVEESRVSLVARAHLCLAMEGVREAARLAEGLGDYGKDEAA